MEILAHKTALSQLETCRYGCRLPEEVVGYICERRGAGLTAAEVAALMAIAAQAGGDPEDRRVAQEDESWRLIWFIGAPSSSGRSKILGGLAAKGLDVRVRYGTDRAGNAIYMRRGFYAYRLPMLCQVSR